MHARIFLMWLCAALAACEAPQAPPAVKVAPLEQAPALREKDTISAVPEHFDRVRAEQFENEEDRLRRSGRRK